MSTTGSFDSVTGHFHYSNVLIQAIPDEFLKGHVYLYILVCPDVNIVFEFECIVLILFLFNHFTQMLWPKEKIRPEKGMKALLFSIEMHTAQSVVLKYNGFLVLCRIVSPFKYLLLFIRKKKSCLSFQTSHECENILACDIVKSCFCGIKCWRYSHVLISSLTLCVELCCCTCNAVALRFTCFCTWQSQIKNDSWASVVPVGLQFKILIQITTLNV